MTSRVNGAFRPETLQQQDRQPVSDELPPFVFAPRRTIPAQVQRTTGTVGSVTPTLRAIMPASVGDDIGCGILSAPTGFRGAWHW